MPRRVVFEPTRVWKFHITIPEKEYAAMQPRSGRGGFLGFGARKPKTTKE
jgi:hypothetical protein